MKTTSALHTTIAGSLGGFAPAATGGVAAPEIVLLAEGAVVSWDLRSRGCTVEILRGSVWLTAEHSPEDFLLAQGESFTLSAAGKVVAQSLLGSATIALIKS